MIIATKLLGSNEVISPLDLNNIRINESVSYITTEDFIKNVHKLPALDFRGCEILNKDASSITAILLGKCRNGSYIEEDEMVSTYITKLTAHFPYKIQYLGGENTASHGRYKFKFENNEILQIGTRIAAKGYEAFVCGFSVPFAILHDIYINM